jgi:hypothetical protein
MFRNAFAVKDRRKVRVFIEHLEKTFALCSQFNPLVGSSLLS